jgi:copper resistance protein B
VKAASLFAVATLAVALPVFAQSHHHDAPEQQSADPHSGHDMSGQTESGTSRSAGNEPPPAPPAENAADRLFSIDEMDAARDQLRREHGWSRVAMLFLNLAEYQVRSQSDGYRWDGEGWFGGDVNRVVVKSEGEGTVDDSVDGAEIQALYSRAISPYFDLQGGVRYDFEPNPSRTYGTIGFEGLAPYWFEVEGALFLSERADLLARLEGYYDQPITQRLIVQPRAEFNFAAQDVRENGIGSGLSDVELGLRLRYEIRREFAPYLGVSWLRKVGDTADFARREGERVSSTSFVLGIRTWF